MAKSSTGYSTGYGAGGSGMTTKKLAPGYNASDTKTKVKKGPKPAKASKGVTGFEGACGGPTNVINGGKGGARGYAK